MNLFGQNIGTADNKEKVEELKKLALTIKTELTLEKYHHKYISIKGRYAAMLKYKTIDDYKALLPYNINPALLMSQVR